MKQLLLFLFAVLFCSDPSPAQPTMAKIFHANYNELPFGLRVENSGIYAMAAFEVTNGSVLMRGYTSPEVFELKDNKAYHLSKQRSIGSALSFAGGTAQSIGERPGDIDLRVLNRSSLLLSVKLPEISAQIRLSFPEDLGYADLIGIDRAGNSYLLIERYISEIPLKVKREIYTIGPDADVRSILEIPSVKYCTTERDFQIDAEGNLYHLYTDRESMIILRWSGLATGAGQRISYPTEYSGDIHFNREIPVREEATYIPDMPLAISSRTTALRLAETYALHTYTCTSADILPTDHAGPDGDIVRTPSWLVAGINARIPYMWGGFSTLAQFDAGLKSGKYAGDINTAGVSLYAVGVDCSGFVSRCWQMSSHYSTSMMPSITTQYASWDSLKPGDGILKSGHVRLFVERTSNGGFRVVESSARIWDVSYWTYTLSDLQSVYTPRRYNNMETNVSTQCPSILSVLTQTNGNIQLSWQCDTTQIAGYRLYRSTDGLQWSLLKDESTLKRGSQTTVAPAYAAEFYRIASVKNDAAKTESDWSNAMGASRDKSTKHYLIVDGFQRQTGSWEGPDHVFAARYGNALRNAGVTFSTAKNSEVLADSAFFFSYDGVFWILGDESTVDETFSSAEQNLIGSYLKAGKKFLVSGSEIGWDLSGKGSVTDKIFFTDYLKSTYKTDNAGSLIVKGQAGSGFEGCVFNIGQTYPQGYPDEIDTTGGSTVCMRYANAKVAGIQYTGMFGGSSAVSRLIYLSFALETTADDTSFNSVIAKSVAFFESKPNAIKASRQSTPLSYSLHQNYPNPFNPSTIIEFETPQSTSVQLVVFDCLGRIVRTIVNENLPAGSHRIQFEAETLAGGVYFYKMTAGNSVTVRRMVLLK
jgi:Secretion system C-terminal sorting domain